MEKNTKLMEYTGKKVTFLCTSACNINCEHCYICYRGQRDPNDLLESVKKLKNKYKIMLNGAEVLTNPEYLSSYKEIGQPWVLTNGLALLNPNIIDALIENNIKSVSLSYHFGIHDSISNVKTSQLLDIINIIKVSGLEFRFLTTITSENYQLIPEICNETYEMGAKGIMFTNFMRQGNGINLSKNLILSKDQLKEFFKYIAYVRSIYNKDDLIIERSGTFGRDLDSINDHFSCDCGVDRVYITPDNNVYPCIFLTKPGYEIGKYIDGRIMISNTFENDHNVCITSEICNHDKSFTKTLKRNLLNRQ